MNSIKSQSYKLCMAIFIALAVLLNTPFVLAADVPQTKADCLAVAAKYDKMAADQDAVTAEHKEMLDKYISATFLPKQTRTQSINKMKKHCNAIIAASEKLSKEYKAMADWHRTHAEMMEQ